MPLYDYDCSGCGPFRAFRPISDSARAQNCPQCAAAAPRKLVAPMLSGSESGGWLGRGGGRPGGWRAACGFGCNHLNCR